MKPWINTTDAERAAIYQDAALRIHDIDWYRFHGMDPRPVLASGGTSYWESSLTRDDVTHLRSLGLSGASIKGNPCTSHLKKAGAEKALCGAAPGGSNKANRKMVDRAGWLVYTSFESPGRTPCNACLKAAETYTPTEATKDPV